MKNDSTSNKQIRYQSVSHRTQGQRSASPDRRNNGNQRRNISSYKIREASKAPAETAESYDTFQDFDQEPVHTEKRRNPASRPSSRSSRPVQQTYPTRRTSGHTSGKKHSSKKKHHHHHHRKSLKRDVLAWILLGLQAALSIFFVVVLLILDVLPPKLLIPLIIVLVILLAAVFISQLKRYKKVPLIGKIFSIILSIILAVGSYYAIITNKAIETVTEETVYNYTYLDVAVLADDPANSINDAKDYTFGVQATYQPLNLKTAVDEIENELGQSIRTKDYDTALNQIDALYAKEVSAVIYNRNFKTTIESVHENFEEEVRIIKTITIKDAVDISSGSSVNVTTDPFLFYISGNDEYGELTIEGRTDVNILVAVNPTSREILMITTPRDFYVVLPNISNGTRDKLTHSGIYGIQCQLDTLNNLYEYDIDYYCKVNFSSLIDIVDAIGGIDVYNEMEFEFDNSDGLIIPEGNVHLNGYEALCFCRERHSFADGDAARARHQQAVIEAIINKLLSSTGFTAYSQLVKTLERCCFTNMPKESISALIKKQLAEGGGWNITKVAAEGEAFLQPTFSMGSMPLYVIMPYQQSLINIRTMLAQVYRGEPVEALYLDEYSDYSLVDQPVAVETIEEDEEGYTVRRTDLVDSNGKVFGQMVRHIDEEDNDRLIKTEYFDLNGNRLTAAEVEARQKGSSSEDDSKANDDDDDKDDETTTTEPDDDKPDDNTDDDGGADDNNDSDNGDNNDENTDENEEDEIL